jgi:hypothetical protein
MFFRNRSNEPNDHVYAHVVVEHLDPVHDVQPGLSPGVVAYLVDPLDSERSEEPSIAALS